MRPKRGTLAAAVYEIAAASDAPSVGAAFANLIDAPGASVDHLDAFVGLLVGEAASAVAVVNAGSIRSAAIVEQTNANATAWWPGTYAFSIVEPTIAGDTLIAGAAPGIIAGPIVETATATDGIITPIAITSGMSAVLEGAFVDPRAPSSLLGSDILDSGPIIVFAAGGSFESGTDPITPEDGIPLVPTGGAVAGGSGSYTVPADWNNASNSIECIGGGAGGLGAGIIWAHGGYGGGGGAYSKITNAALTPGAVINFHIGEGGAWNADGGDTWCISSSTVYAQGGKGATGGQASAGIGTVKYDGGNGGPGGTGGRPEYYGAGGGGGAAGPNGAGAAGGLGINDCGGGGGAGSGGAVGGASVYTIPGNGGAGGNSYSGTGGGAAGMPGSPVIVNGGAGKDGGGGGGGSAYFSAFATITTGYGGKGGNGREWGRNIGAGGGGGGAGACMPGGHGGYYGAGGGGANSGVTSGGAGTSIGGAGASGIIIIRYNP